jgi:pyruvate kinase
MAFNRSKIVATVGPASNSRETLRELMETGVNVFRLNFSHGTHDQHREVINLVRSLNEELGLNVSLLQDLQGPKIRVGEVEKGTKLEAGNTFIITTEEVVGNAERASTVYKGLATDLSVDDRVLIDDGKIELQVIEIRENDIVTVVLHGGKLKSRKGINLPNTHVSAPSLTDKDLHDLDFGLDQEVDWIALSFVRSAEDIHDLRNRIRAAGKDCRIVAKIEKPEAIHNIDDIIDASDAIMVARGDLGVEILMEEVPMAQKMIVKKCNLAAKPVIIATQMMESMIDNPRPTRAETNDVANAVMDGADALMLSAETAAGQYPVAVVKSMINTIISVEKQGELYYKFYKLDTKDPLFHNDSIIKSACQLAEISHARAIIGMTASGYTAFKISSHRPHANIFIFTHNRPLLNTMNLIWGVRGYYYASAESTDQTFEDIENILCEKGHLNAV